MSRQIEIEFPDPGIRVTATLLEIEEPELSKRLWEDLGNPIKFACYHTLSTGELFIGKAKPPKEPCKIGSQANPLGRNHKLLCDLDPGMLVYTGLDIWAAYGEDITEPLVPSGAVVAKVDKKHLDDFRKAGKSVWDAQYTRHRLITMTISRKEE